MRQDIELARRAARAPWLSRSTPLTDELDLIAAEGTAASRPPNPPVSLHSRSEVLMAGILPVMTASVRLSALAAPATCCSLPMLLTDDADKVPWPMLVRWSMLIVVPDAGRDWLPTRPRKPNPPGRREPAVGVWVTVTSVPTPYSEWSTVRTLRAKLILAGIPEWLLHGLCGIPVFPGPI